MLDTSLGAFRNEDVNAGMTVFHSTDESVRLLLAIYEKLMDAVRRNLVDPGVAVRSFSLCAPSTASAAVRKTLWSICAHVRRHHRQAQGEAVRLRSLKAMKKRKSPLWPYAGGGFVVLWAGKAGGAQSLRSMWK